MDNKFGFYISKLQVTGPNVKPAKLNFTKGFNVVSGLSETGKSYIFACLNFMLGGGDSPKDIPESVGYTDIWIEIKTFSDKTYTLKRPISGGNFKLKETELEKFPTQGVERNLYYQHSPTNKDNISNFLLGLSGFDDTFVRINKLNVKRELSFRDIAKLTLIDEERIITEKSPVYSGQFSEQVQNQSVLEILLTGRDAKNLEQIEEEKVYTSRIIGKIEFVDSLINELSEKLITLDEENPIEKQALLQARVDALSQVLAESSTQLERLSTEKQKVFNEIAELESKNMLQEELINRFILLKEHYNSDIKRLEFITEGEEYFSQLTAIKCPLCGGDMDKDHYDCIIDEKEKSSSVINAIGVELEKIKIKLSDLESTLIQLDTEKSNRNLHIDSLKRRLSIINIEIQEKLEPVKSSTKQEIEVLLGEMGLIKEQDVLKHQLTNYYSQKSSLNRELAKKPQISEPAERIAYTALQSFCDIIKELLTRWKYPQIANVNFDDSYKIYDIVINNKNRKAHGKGIRPITYTSFIIALMEFCVSKNLPHSRNIIIDSPLTTYQGKEPQSSIEEISKDMEDAFFSDLAAIDKNRQILILDNKDPNEELKSKINYIHFTGDKSTGRQGFFPS